MADQAVAKPRTLKYPPLRIVRFASCGLFSKYRNKIGLDVALGALRACRRRKDWKLDEIWKYATQYVAPYLEALA